MKCRAIALIGLAAACGAALAQLAAPLPAPIRPPVIYVPPFPSTVQILPPAEYWGAIAYERATGNFGYAFDFPSERDASVAALQSCAEPDCVVEVAFRSGCGVLLEGPAGPVTALGATAREAETRARATCTDVSCRVVAWACTR
jgi:hypothetical protein